MRDSPPAVLVSLLTVSSGTADSERAWAAFAEEYSTLLLHVARRLGGGDDAAMDRYAFMLDALRRDDYRRLRQYASDGRGKFTTWLMVVARRLCLDEYRRRYGRPQGDDTSSTTTDAWAERRRLINLVGEELGAAEVAGSADAVPDVALQRSELAALLEAALARLDTPDRLLLRLRFIDDLSVPQIARLLGEGSAFYYYRRLEKILARLRESLQAAGVENSVP
jgi:RNA polymerase sigma factor (sigma-70 family)